ncbi:MAG: hypothetical protein IKG14_05545 [Clostridia bacterium]|nr:hypothetical protein [Clostridia bacterium]
MKSNSNNIFIVLFILVVMGLIGGAVYILYFSQETTDWDEEEIEEVNETTETISVVGNLKMGISNFDTMNPLLSNNKEILNIDKLIFEPLINITSDYNTEKCLAKEINKTSDNEYQIKLDTSIKWQDGSSLISKDIQYTVDRLKEINSIYSPNVRFIESVEVPDSETAIIKLTEPVRFFEYYLDFPIVSSSYYLNEDFQSSGKIPIGTGMYKIASIDDDKVFLIRNDRWRFIKEKTPKTESITITKSTSMGEIFNSFKLGNMDIINTNMPNYAEFVGTMGYNRREYAGRNYDFIAINCYDSLLSSKEVRKAINLAINRDNIISSVFNGTKTASYSPLDYGSYLYDTNTRVKSNQEEAKKILENDGWTYTNERWQKNIDGYVARLTLSMVVCDDNEERLNTIYNIQSQLQEVGIVLNVARVNRDRYYQFLNEKNYQMILTGVTNSVNPDLSYFYGQNNIANYYNDDIMSKIEILDKYSEIEKQVADDVPYIGLYRNKGAVILNANVGGDFKSNNYYTYYNFNEWFRQQ